MKPRAKWRLAALTVLAIEVSTLSALAGETRPPPGDAAHLERSFPLGEALMRLGGGEHDKGAVSKEAMSLASDALSSSRLPAIWPNAPDWLRRTEWDVQFNGVNGPDYTFLTVQPLWQSEGHSQTLFYQASYEHYRLYDIGRNTVNGGLGYRTLVNGNQLLLGLNNFYDFEIDNGHARTSVGAEAKWGMLDFYANYYLRLSGKKDVEGASEEVNNGFDIGLSAPLPYLPWAKVYGTYYRWDGIAGADSDGLDLGAELALTPNLSLTAGTRGDQPDTTERNDYVMLQFRLGNDEMPTLLSKPIGTAPFEHRDLAKATLEKVRRENRIHVERSVTSGGITVVVKRTG